MNENIQDYPPFEVTKTPYDPFDLIGSLDEEDQEVITEELNITKTPIMG